MTTAIQSNQVLLDGELRPAKVTWCDGVISQIESFILAHRRYS